MDYGYDPTIIDSSSHPRGIDVHDGLTQTTVFCP
jgi:hypothetical protein